LDGGAAPASRARFLRCHAPDTSCTVLRRANASSGVLFLRGRRQSRPRVIMILLLRDPTVSVNREAVYNTQYAARVGNPDIRPCSDDRQILVEIVLDDVHRSEHRAKRRKPGEDSRASYQRGVEPSRGER